MMKLCAACLLAFAFTLFFSPAFTQDKTLYDSAKKLLPNQAVEAEKLALEFLRQAREKNVDSSLARGHYLLGTINYYLGHYYISVDYFQKALKSDFMKKDLKLAESCWNNIGASSDKLNLLPQALSAYQESLKLAEQRRDSTGIAETWINIGLLAGRVKNYKEADATTRRALAYFTGKKDTLNISLCFQNLSVFYAEQGSYDSAYKYNVLSLQLYQAIGDVYGETVLTNNLGVRYSDKKQYDLAIATQEKALRMARELGMIGFEGTIFMNLGENYLALKNYPEAEKNFKLAFLMSDSAQTRDNYERLYWLMTDLYAQQGNYQQYRKWAAAFQDFLEKEAEAGALARYDELKNLYELEKKEAQILAQSEKLRQRRNQLLLMGGAILLICGALVFITILYIRSKKLMRSLYLSNVAQVRQPRVVVETVATSQQEKEGRSQHAELFARIEDQMAEEKLFRRPNLTIADLSAALGSNDKYISQAINSLSGKNFSGFLNDYRINEAKRLMLSGQELTLKQIAADCGFSNPSTFYRQFKDLTGLTPSSFYEMCRQGVQHQEV